MNGIHPAARYMVACEDITLGPGNANRVSLHGCLWNLHPPQIPPFPYIAPVLCVFVALTECTGSGSYQLQIVHPASGMVLYATPPIAQTFGNDPLVVHGLRFRIRGIPFPQAGVYEVEFSYQGAALATQPLRVT